jgi:death-on-curing protein
LNYISYEQALLIAEAVSGIDALVFAKTNRIYLLDSALNAPRASFGGQELYEGVLVKAAILVSRICRNHPLPDGNKRLAWISLLEFLFVNGFELSVDEDDAVEFMLKVAANEIGESDIEIWISQRASTI